MKHIKHARIYTVILFCLLLACPLYANVRLCIKENLDYLKDVMSSRFCKIPVNVMEDGSCHYQWLLNLKKNSVDALPDSLIYDLWGLIDNYFLDFPSNVGKHYMNDPFCVAFYAAVFCDKTMPIDRQSQAFDVLLRRTSSGVLLPHRAKIISSPNWQWLSFEQRAIMAALLKCTEKEREHLFKKQETFETFPLRAKAIYGDKKAIAELIAQFDDTTKTYESRMTAMNYLVTSGNKQALRHVIEQFGRIRDPGPNDCVSLTSQYKIVKILSYHHSDDPIFNEKLSNALTQSFVRMGEPTQESQIAVAEYYKELYEWMYDNYKVKLLDPPPYNFFTRLCIKRDK